MAWNHVALATKDLAATHRFYTEVMGFRLAKVVAAPTPGDTGWARHAFYDCGDGQYMAFWDIHDATIGDEYETSIARAAGLPGWTNHLAWDAPDQAAYDAHLLRWREHGIAVAEVDHGFCKSIYCGDPNGIMVEFCLMTRELTADDQAEAEHLLFAEVPELETPPEALFHEPLVPVTA